jgi:hypothetical protein
VRLGARQRTIACLTGLPTSFIFHNIYDAEHLPPRGRPPYTEDFIYRSSLKVQAEVGMFAAKYRLLTAEGIAPAQALITAFRHYRSVVHQPSFSFDEAFFVVSNLDGIWAASTRTLELGACRRCGCLHLLPRGAAPAAAGCPYCRPHRTDRAPARAPPHPDHTAPASGTDAEAATVPAALEAQIRSLRTERMFEQLGAHPRVVATLTGASAPADRRSSSRHREGPTHVGRAVNLIRWGVAVKTVQRAQFSLVANCLHPSACRRLRTRGRGPGRIRPRLRHVPDGGAAVLRPLLRGHLDVRCPLGRCRTLVRPAVMPQVPRQFSRQSHGQGAPPLPVLRVAAHAREVPLMVAHVTR